MAAIGGPGGSGYGNWSMGHKCKHGGSGNSTNGSGSVQNNATGPSGPPSSSNGASSTSTSSGS